MGSILQAAFVRLGRQRHLGCSFCGRGASEVARLVGGPRVHICDACVGDCVGVLEQHGGFERPALGRPTDFPPLG